MGLFGTTSTYDADVERATGEADTNTKDAARDCLKAILKRMKNAAPHVALQALTLLDACEKNCGRPFRLEIASRLFEDEVKNILSNSRIHPAVREKLKLTIKQWAHEPEIIANPELKLIPDMYKSLAAQGFEFPKTTSAPTGPLAPSATTTSSTRIMPSNNAVSQTDADAIRRREEEDFARAIAMSLREAEQSGIPIDDRPAVGSVIYSIPSTAAKSTTASSTSSLYGNLLRDSVVTTPAGGSSAVKTTTTPKSSSNQVKFDDSNMTFTSGSRGSGNKQQQNKQHDPVITDYSQMVEPKRYRVLYDFEAVESDELTLKAGEIVLVNDDSDPSWWKGSNPRGEGLFPANFVTDQLDVDVDAVAAREFNKKMLMGDENEDDENDDEGKATPTGLRAKSAKTITVFPEPLKIDESIIDRALELIHNADLTGEQPDDESLGAYESRAYDMTPLIDAELEQVDRQHLKLTQLGQRLFEAIKLYHETMATQQAAAPPQPLSYQQQQQYTSAAGMQQQQHPIMTSAVYQHQQSYPPAAAAHAFWPPHSVQQQRQPEFSTMSSNNNIPSAGATLDQQPWMPPHMQQQPQQPNMFVGNTQSQQHWQNIGAPATSSGMQVIGANSNHTVPPPNVGGGAYQPGGYASLYQPPTQQ